MEVSWLNWEEQAPFPLPVRKAWWVSAIVVNSLGSVSNIYFLARYFFDPVYVQPTMRACIPILVGNLIGALSMLSQNAYLLANHEGLQAQGPEGILDASVMCYGTGCCLFAALFIRWAGYCFLMYIPLELVRCAKEFKIMKFNKKLVAATIGAGTWIGVSAAVLYHLLFGAAQYRGVTCSPKLWGGWRPFLSMLILVELGCLACFLFRKASLEMKTLGANAHIKRLKKKAYQLKKYSSVFLLITTGCILPYSITTSLISLDSTGTVNPPAAWIMIVSLLTHSESIFACFTLWIHARNLRRKRVLGMKAVKTDFTETEKKCLVDTTELCNRGLSIHFLQWFVKEYGIDKQKTIGQVMSELVKAPTEKRGCNYCEFVDHLWDGEGRPAVGKAEYFVSHCWGDTFQKLMEQLLLFYRHKGTSGTVYFWIDIFAINQHEGGISADLAKMHTVIQESSGVLLTLNPWTAPQTLSRVWCLWEILQALKNSKEVVPIMPASEEHQFLRCMRKDRNRILEVVEGIDAQNAKATFAADKDMIFDQIASTVGFDTMNSMLKVNLNLYLQGIAVDRTVLASTGTTVKTQTAPMNDDFGVRESHTSVMSVDSMSSYWS